MLYNGFGNVVQDVAEAKSVEDVDHFLNDNNVVASVQAVESGAGDEFYDELARVMAVTAEDAQPTDEAPADGQATPPVDAAEPTTEPTVEQLASEVAELRRTVQALSEQQYAYTTPANDAYDLNSQELEVQHFNEAAENTQRVIDEENMLDLTKPAHRGRLNYTFLNNLFGGLLSEEAKQQIIDGVEQQLTEDALTEDAPSEDAPTVDEPIPADVPADMITTTDGVGSVGDVTAADEQQPVDGQPVPDEQDQEKPEQVGDSMVVEGDDAPTDDVPADDMVVEAAEGADAAGEGGQGQVNAPLSTGEGQQLLGESDLATFMNGDCPKCGGGLELVEDVDEDSTEAMMACSSCGRWFKVDLVSDQVSLLNDAAVVDEHQHM